MRGVSRTGLAALLVCVLVLTGSFLVRPVVPSVPAAPWHWLAPWRTQSVQAGEEFNPYIWGMELVLLGVLAREVLEGLQELAAEQLYDAIRDYLEGSGGNADPAGGGGGAELWP